MALENFTTYVEYDLVAHFTVAANAITVIQISGRAEAYVYKDLGANHFGASFTHYAKVKTTNSSASNSTHVVAWAVSNVIDDNVGWDTNNSQAVNMWDRKTVNAYSFVLRNEESGSSDASVNLTANTYYWLTITRTSETALQIQIYSDAAKTTLVDTMSVALTSGRRYQYLFAANGQDEALTNSLAASIEDFDLNEAGGQTYDETGRAELVAVTSAESDVATYAESGRAELVAVSEAVSAVAVLAEADRAILVAVTELESDLAALSEGGRAILIAAIESESDAAALVEVGRAVLVAVMEAETDAATWTETSRAIPVEVATAESDTATLGESARSILVAVTVSVSDALGAALRIIRLLGQVISTISRGASDSPAQQLEGQDDGAAALAGSLRDSLSRTGIYDVSQEREGQT